MKTASQLIDEVVAGKLANDVLEDGMYTDKEHLDFFSKHLKLYKMGAGHYKGQLPKGTSGSFTATIKQFGFRRRKDLQIPGQDRPKYRWEGVWYEKELDGNKIISVNVQPDGAVDIQMNKH